MRVVEVRIKIDDGVRRVLAGAFCGSQGLLLLGIDAATATGKGLEGLHGCDFTRTASDDVEAGKWVREMFFFPSS